jgi:hypothetical protein
MEDSSSEGVSDEQVEKEVKSILKQLYHPYGARQDSEVQRLGSRAQALMGYLTYISQKSSERQTRRLATATTILAVATVILAIVTYLR